MRIEISYQLVPGAGTEGGRLFCGAGIGRAGVDLIALKGRDGLPYIPGSTVKGVIREKFIELAQACGLEPARQSMKTFRQKVMSSRKESDEPHFHHLLTLSEADQVFGSPQQQEMCSVFSDLRLEKASAEPAVMQRVRMDRRLGRPIGQNLFDVEYQHCGALNGKITLWRSFDGEQKTDLPFALLLGGIMMLRNIGGHRSTGAGWVVPQITGIDSPYHQLKRKNEGSDESFYESFRDLLEPLGIQSTGGVQ